MAINKMHILGLGIIFVFMLLLAALASAATPASSDITPKTCRLTAECDQGYCENGICTFPTVIEKYKEVGTCVYTADCQQGFCRNGKCILLEREEFTIITLGAKSGCAGIIENCTGVWCYFCNVTWVFLIVGSVVAAWAGRKRGRLAMIVMLVIPFVFGYFILPILGFILSLVEIMILLVVKKEKKPQSLGKNNNKK
ncbi:MAG: hypothetical protein QW112_01395 [Candidatus Micrarchaeia archaeon]